MARSTEAVTKLERSKRHYHAWVVNETLEDYSLRYAPKSFRRWSEFTLANTALGGISYLADFAIGGSISFMILPPILVPPSSSRKCRAR